MKAYLLFLCLFAVAIHAVPHTDVAKRTVQAPTTYWYEQVKHNGVVGGSTTYSVFRNVKDYGAKGDGITDDTAAIQSTINTGTSTSSPRSSNGSSYGAQAVVYFPAGTYLVKNGLYNYVNTVLMGDLTNRPTIKAGPNFSGDVLLTGQDTIATGLIGFYYEIKNLILDTTSVPLNKSITLLTWSVSQACQVSNVMFNMPIEATGHTGIATTGQNSPLLLNDLQFSGGGIGLSIIATQYQFKTMYFKSKPVFVGEKTSELGANGWLIDVITGLKIVQLLQGTGQGLRFEGCTTGIDLSGNPSGNFNLIDSTASNTTTVVSAGGLANSGGTFLVLENVIVDSSVPAVSLQSTVTGLRVSLLSED